MNKIIELPQNLVNKIAAGEVIERPASVIKELIENSIDAKSDKIEIEVEEGGIKSLAIYDNGQGMNEKNALKCFKLHTTSKISSENDLDNILTLGFRGEALASICAVSEVMIHTKDTSTKSTKLIIENSELKSTSHEARSQGTTIIVQDVFRHLPARKKFLKTAKTEYRHILNIVNKFALIHPEISFKLTHNTKTTLDLKKTEDPKERITDVLANIQPEDLITLDIITPQFNINGYIIHPSKLSSDRNKQFLYINTRAISDNSLNKAIKDGYGTSIPYEKQPAYILNIELDPSEIDVNIHPRKAEVKISNISDIFRALKINVNQAISRNSQDQLMKKLGREEQPEYSQTESEYTPSPGTKKNQENFSYTYKSPSVSKNSISDLKPKDTYNNEIKQSLDFTQSLLELDSTETKTGFQVFETYIIIQNKDTLEIIDQHAADERVNYEKTLDKLNKDNLIERQDLLLPITQEVSKEDIEIIKDNLDSLKSIGLDIDIFGETTIKINSIPQFSREVNYKDLLAEIIQNFRDKGDINREDLNHRLAASIACHGSIRAGKKLTQFEINKLISDLFKCEIPYSCPHGRPIIWTLNKNEIEKKFERIK